MALAPQLGDLVKFAELGWKVYNYGWADDMKASRQYQEFMLDIRHLAQSLDALSNVIYNASKTFQDRGLLPPDNLTFAWDVTSLIDIIGDYETTLNECIRLLDNNRAYRSTTSPGENIVWNIFVQPNVERLRKQILLHNTKIQLVLRPFEIDLRLRIHNDIVHRIEGVREDVQGVRNEVQGMRRELQELRRYFDPALVRDTEEQYGLEDSTVQIPECIRQELEHSYDRHPEREFEGFDKPPLREIADAFVRFFDVSTRIFQPDETFREPTEEQYLNLLTSQFLMNKMLVSNEYLDPPGFSHWPRYVKSLRQQLSRECQRFARHMTMPIVTDVTRLPAIWRSNEMPAAHVESVRLPVMMEYLLEMPLKSHNPDRWRRLKLLRYCDGTDRRFRLVLTSGGQNQPPSEPRPIDFDISTACLVPRYASYEDPGSLELVLKLSGEMHSLLFCTKADLYKFQQALTGYEPVDQFMPYNLQVIFVLASNRKVKEYASMQLWRPIRLDGERVMDDPDSQTPFHGDDGASISQASKAVASRAASRLSTATSPFFQPPPHQRTPSPRTSTITTSPIDPPTSPLFNPWSPTNPINGSSPPRPLYSPIQHQVGSSPPTTTIASRVPMRAASVASSSSNSSSSTARAPAARGRQASTTTTITTTTTSYTTARTGATSVVSTAFSTASYATRPVSISGATTLAGTGTLHCKPTEPLLVLFTQNCETGHHGIVAITLDSHTNANYRACQCISNVDCRVAALERGTGGTPLTVLRLGGTGTSTATTTSTKYPSSATTAGAQWDLFPLSEPLRGQRSSRARRAKKDWRKVIRVSICLRTPDLRREFIGMPCNCPQGNEGELMACLAQWHRGRLGLVKEWFRREMHEWNRMRYGGGSGGSVILTSQRGEMPGMGWS